MAAALALAAGLSGCVSKAKAKKQADAAFAAGQQQALARMRQPQAQPGMVTIHGAVRQPVIPWTSKMTLGSALIAADYFGPDPTTIFIVRNGRAMQVDPSQLLAGQDVQLVSGDIVQIDGATGPVPGFGPEPAR